MIVTILGSGTSGGIPMIGCPCPVCRSTDSRDKRLRTSIHISINGKSFVIDAGPDFRQQMLRESISRLDAIIFTHQHRDHT
ncbi:MAG TPA: MBL fold metallo-hydrolase, partial [Chitinophagales bacterium]|nr:MBL fold metallo-hydrolase [Chitinophagales bacterium]